MDVSSLWNVDGTSLFQAHLLKPVSRSDGSCLRLSSVTDRYRQCTIPNDHGFHIILRGHSRQRAVHRILQFVASLELRQPAIYSSALHQQVTIDRDDVRRYLARAAP